MRGKQGFTLIEVIVSIAIVGIILVPLLSIFNTSLMNILRAGMITEAVELAEINIDNEPLIIQKPVNVTIPTDSGDIDIPIEGSEITGKYTIFEGTIKEKDITIITYIPNN